MVNITRGQENTTTGHPDDAGQQAPVQGASSSGGSGDRSTPASGTSGEHTSIESAGQTLHHSVSFSICALNSTQFSATGPR